LTRQAQRREQSGDPQGALRLYRLAADYSVGWWPKGPVDRIADLLERTGDQAGAENLRQNGMSDDGSVATIAPWS
jgi:hypothetical protein